MDRVEAQEAGEERNVVTEVVQQGGGEAAGMSSPQAKPQRKALKGRGLGRIYKRGGVWWIQYSFRGKLYRETSKSEVHARARDLLNRRHAEMGQGRLVGPNVERTTFEDLAEMLFNDYRVNGRKSLDRAERSVEHLKTFFSRAQAIDITPDRVSAYIDSRMPVAKPATIRLELAALKRMFTLGLRAGKVSHRPYFPSIAVSNARRGFFEQAELQAVIAELPADVAALVQFLASTGWRLSEAKSLRWAQVDTVGGVVRLEVGSTKSGEGRVFPFAALPALATLIRTRRERTSAVEKEQGGLIPFVFHRRGAPIRSFHHAWRGACKRACVPGRLIHDLRRTAARNLVRSGVPERIAMVLLGHKTRSVFDRYNIVNESDLAEAVRKLAAFKPLDPGEQRHVVMLPEVPEVENQHGSDGRA